MLVYLYDGSWEGLLTAVFEGVARKEWPQEIAVEGEWEPCLFAEGVPIVSDGAKAERVMAGIEAKVSREALRHAYYAFLSEDPRRGVAIYRYLCFGLQVGPSVDRRLTDGRVMAVHRLSQKVRKEKHLFLGFVRFRKLAGEVYYGPIEPDGDIVALLAPHFFERMGATAWVIHDLRRGKGVVCDGADWWLQDLGREVELPLDGDEAHWQGLWKTFFEHLSIPERKNPRLQRRLMPQRYWRHLVEEPGKG